MMLLEWLAGFNLFGRLLQMDYWLFGKINQQWTNPFFDFLLPYLRESEIWIPFYLFLLVFVTINFGVKGWWWSLTLIMTGIMSDLVSSHLIKQFIFRYRPCRDPSMSDHVPAEIIVTKPVKKEEGYPNFLLPYLRESEIWIPFYLFLLVFCNC